MDYENKREIDDAAATTPERRHSKRVGRELAMQYLFQCALTGEKFSAGSWEAFLEQASEEHKLGDNRYGRKCRDYAEKLLEAYNRDADKIEQIIADNTRNWEVTRISAVDLATLRYAIAEMLSFTDVPPVVCIDEAVSITRDYSDPGACDFINGILNAFKDTLPRPPREGVKA